MRGGVWLCEEVTGEKRKAAEKKGKEPKRKVKIRHKKPKYNKTTARGEGLVVG